jgi:orsellinic acid C2-O-methyltransferase
MVNQSIRDQSQELAAHIRGYIVTQIIAAAVRFRIPDYLADGPMSCKELSEFTGIGDVELRRFLLALEGLGLVEHYENDSYRNYALADVLRRDVGGLYGQALMSGSEYYRAWEEFDYALRHGRSAFEKTHNRTLWEEFEHNSVLAASFTRTTRWNTERVLDELMHAYDFPSTGVIADIGAGDGTLIAGLLERFPELRAVVLESGAVVEQARFSLRRRGVLERCLLVSGDFRESVPAGADVYILKSILHNWHDDDVLRILCNCRQVLGPNGKLVVVERVLVRDDALGAAIRDLTMLVLFGGRDRTEDEYANLLMKAGLSVSRKTMCPSGYCLLEGFRL